MRKQKSTTVQNESSITSFLNAPAVPEPGSLPERWGKEDGKITNLASSLKNRGMRDVCDKFRTWASSQVRRFENQEERRQQMRTGGEMDIADRMYSVSLNRDTSSRQYQATLSDVTSPMFRVQVRTLTASLMSIFFGDNKLPAEYSPEVNTDAYTKADGDTIADHHNALSEFTFDEDRRRPKIRELIELTNKYGNMIAYMEWVREVKEVTENVPDIEAGIIEETGAFRQFKRVTTQRPVKDWPSLRLLPIEHTYFDAHIEQLDAQRCFAFRERRAYEDLLQMQSYGYIDNVSDIDATHLYEGEQANQDSNSPLEDRKFNAGEGTLTERTGEVEVWTVWGVVPIDENTSKKSKYTKASFNGSKNPPQLYYGMFAGNLHNGNAVCLKLCKNPHWNKGIPAILVSSHSDDKGAYHRGDAHMIQSLYWQAVTNLNQASDNITKRNSAPLKANGPVFTKDLTYKQNKVIQIDRATTLETMPVPDTTAITLEMHRLVESQANSLTGADKPLRGEALGSRTSARESQNIFDQASLPLDERAGYFADQFFTWLLEWDQEMWRQYGDPSVRLGITHKDVVFSVNPGELYGPLRTKVTAMSRFRNNTTQRQQKNNFLGNVLPLFFGELDSEGRRELGRQVFKDFGIENTDKIFPAAQSNFDAETRANQAINSMLVLGEWVDPEVESDHRTWIPVLEAAATQYRLLPEESFASENHQKILQHIAMRKDMLSRKQSPTPPPIGAGVEPKEDTGLLEPAPVGPSPEEDPFVLPPQGGGVDEGIGPEDEILANILAADEGALVSS